MVQALTYRRVLLKLSGEALIIGAVGGGAAWTVNCAITVSVLCPKTNERLA